MPMAHIHGHGTGFTVLELLVTLTIAAILLGAGVPTFQQFTQRQHMKAAVGSLHNDLLLARSEAVYRNLEVVACPGDPAMRLQRRQRLEPRLDRVRRRQRRPPAAERRNPAAARSVVRAPAHHQLRRPQQHPLLRRTAARPGSNAGIAFCGPGGPAQARRLVVSNVGRIRREDYPKSTPPTALDSPAQSTDNTAPRMFSPVAQLVRAGDC
jgi:prepilin-type N-terminal cleavage/methylation domain-containing protein